MDNLLIDIIKRVMVYYRNNPEDRNLCIVVPAIKSFITGNTGNNKILIQVLEENIPALYLGKFNKGCLYFSGGGFQEIWQFISSSLDIMVKASRHEETVLVYDISDMLQGIPDFEYWALKKNMHFYWKDYVRPVKRKLKLPFGKF